MAQTEHVGLTALDAERSKLLQEYDAAVQQAGDDPVKTEHGVSCEARFRSFLAQFLPKKYGVTKGYIITPDLAYAGPLEEWDIIIYDALESPVLFVRTTQDDKDSAGKRGIPVEYVRGVIEVKATLNKASATKVTEKLLKLRRFDNRQPGDVSPKSSILPAVFHAAAIFFETRVRDSLDFSMSLGALGPLWHDDPLNRFFGALILRGQTHPDRSARIVYNMFSSPRAIEMWLPPGGDISPPFTGATSKHEHVVSEGFGHNEFWHFMIDLVHTLNGAYGGHGGRKVPETLRGGYGLRRDDQQGRSLFPGVQLPFRSTEDYGFSDDPD